MGFDVFVYLMSFSVENIQSKVDLSRKKFFFGRLIQITFFFIFDFKKF